MKRMGQDVMQDEGGAARRTHPALRDTQEILIAKDVKGATELVPKTYSLIDRAAKWGIIKKNTAARYKSRLTIRLRKIASA